MVILGLGSNVGDRLAFLRKALHSIKNIANVTVRQVSPLYLSDALLPENSPPEWDKPHLNLAITCDTTLSPHALLEELKNIEKHIGRKPAMRHWGPREVDIDILAFDDLIIKTDKLTIPHENLQERPFALWPLADLHPLWIFPLPGSNHGKTAEQISEKWGSRFNGNAPLHTRQIYQRVDTAQLVGILNITPDSFSDGGQFLDVEKALRQAQTLVMKGAEIIDIGAESTAPLSHPINAITEWERLYPVLSAIKEVEKDFLITPKISIDTRHAYTAKKALEMNIDWINDVSGLDNPAMREIVKETHVECIIMHHLHIPERRKQVLSRTIHPVKQVLEWAEVRLTELEAEGISRDKLIFDPGIGFGKMAEQSLVLLKNIAAFNTLKMRLLVGPSRKSFLSLLTDASFRERDIETAAIALYLSNHGVDFLRVHAVETCARMFKTMGALSESPPQKRYGKNQTQ